jgi:hypothetical protein
MPKALKPMVVRKTVLKAGVRNLICSYPRRLDGWSQVVYVFEGCFCPCRDGCEEGGDGGGWKTGFDECWGHICWDGRC